MSCCEPLIVSSGSARPDFYVHVALFNPWESWGRADSNSLGFGWVGRQPTLAVLLACQLLQ